MFKKYQWKSLPILLALVDGFMLFLSLNLAFLIRFRLNLSIFQAEAMYSPSYYINLELVMVGVTCCYSWLLVYTAITTLWAG